MRRSSHAADHHRLTRPGEGEPFDFGLVQVHSRFVIGGDATAGRFVVADMPEIPPRALAAPLHRHHNEDEYTYAVDGTLGTMAGAEAVTVGPGTWLVKPRGEWHTFWNPGDTPCHIIEIVSPAGFEEYFREVARSGGDPQQLAQINKKYAIDMNFDSTPKLCQRFGLTFPEMKA